MEENQVIDAPAPEVVAQEVETVTQAFTADDLAKARAQEKAKLYPQMEKISILPIRFGKCQWQIMRDKEPNYLAMQPAIVVRDCSVNPQQLSKERT